ncbi:ATP-dependent DNA helicase [Alteromonas oceanisediminis]|uniref:ATP-dependent DNA helicase n=1 Tax=Alteromonas oceanisediminis TaxID=2836180 RepID=UPI001BD9BC88|nr:ATP-dependent DNA helicase [Alteromonas oceanisediminis]MBT0587465.1 ATP-dependent DNA helicase [Alteromonas oceanisediminis]
MPNISSIFSPSGLLAEHISGYTPRQAQTDMASAVVTALREKSSLIVEAGTGTGKTFAYLAPVLTGQRKVIVSTGTKNLQEQLYHRDLPVIKAAVSGQRPTALLKGRANYLCIHRLKQNSAGTALYEADTLAELTAVRAWAESTKSGDIGELTTIPEDAKVLPLVTSTVDNCAGKECPDYEDCYLVKARKKAMEADIVVVNHHLFFADMALKDTGFGELIPEVDAVIFDEAHQIPEIASEYFGETLSSRQLMDMCKDVSMLYRTVLKDAQQLDKAAEKCRTLLQDFRLLFPETAQRGDWRKALMNDEIDTAIKRISDALDVLQEVAKLHVGRDKDLDTFYDRLSQARDTLKTLMDVNKTGVSLWFETTPRHFILHLTPLSIANKFRAFVENGDKAWIFTSATLMVDGGFSHFQRRMGLESAKTLMLDSPFDYQKQSMLCVPRFLPEPNHPHRNARLVEIAQQIIEASNGRCFLLFTSHATLRHVSAQLAELTDRPLLVQGTTSKRALLQNYLDDKQSVLLGTGAFWEGVDVRGNDLICVMIDKLPFASPDDPLLQARSEDCKRGGGNPFAQISIPHAVIALKQGAGRLIRDASDRGVLIICDHRLVTKDYGKIFLSSLPPMKRSRDLTETLTFLETIRTAGDNALPTTPKEDPVEL